MHTAAEEAEGEFSNFYLGKARIVTVKKDKEWADKEMWFSLGWGLFSVAADSIAPEFIFQIGLFPKSVSIIK